MWWIEPGWVAPLRHRQAVRVLLLVWIVPPVGPVLLVNLIGTACIVAAVALFSRDWKRHFVTALENTATVAAIVLTPLLAMLYVLVAYVSRLVVINKEGILINERWYRRGTIRSARVRRLRVGRRLLRITGTGRRPSIVAVPSRVTDLELQQLLTPMLRPNAPESDHQQGDERRA